MILRLNKDIITDKYHNGYVTFPKGTVVEVCYEEHLDTLQFIDVKPLSIIDKEQPTSFLVSINDIDFT